LHTAYRRLETLIFEGAHLGAVRSELELRPPEDRADLCRYAWGLLDQSYEPEEEAALWLYAWALASRARNGHQPRSGARIGRNPR
jgi:hypothetical protein